MARFKPVKGKRQRGPSARQAAGLPCVIIVIGGMILLMLFLYLVMKNANG
jgi:hypothetical protein